MRRRCAAAVLACLVLGHAPQGSPSAPQGPERSRPQLTAVAGTRAVTVSQNSVLDVGAKQANVTGHTHALALAAAPAPAPAAINWFCGLLAVVLVMSLERCLRFSGPTPGRVANPERSALMDHAKFLAMFLVISGHVFYYNLVHEYADTNTWLAGSEGLLITLLGGGGIMDMPIFCFLSGVLSQGPATPVKMRKYIQFLVVPTVLWTFIVKPVFIDALIGQGSLAENLKALVELRAFHEEWYLQALVLWRGSALLIWSHFRPQVSLFGMLTLSCLAGYCELEAWNVRFLKLDATFGFLPYFAVGYAFPYEAVVEASGRHPYASTTACRLLVACLAVLYCYVFLPAAFNEPFPDAHCSYSACGAGPAFLALDPVSYALYWTRRLARVALELLPTFAVLFFALPRSRTPFSWIGTQTLYPFLLHEVTNFWRNKLVASVPLPTVTSLAGHWLVVLLHVPYVCAVMCLCASPPCRWVLDWCLKPSWLEHLFQIRGAERPSPLLQLPSAAPDSESPKGSDGAASVSTADESPPCAGSSSSVLTPSMGDLVSDLRVPLSNTPSEAPCAVGGALPQWRFQCRASPWQSDARRFYKYLLPGTLLLQLVSLGSLLVMMNFFVIPCLSAIPLELFRLMTLLGTAVRLVTATLRYLYHYRRLRGTAGLPPLRLHRGLDDSGRLHCAAAAGVPNDPMLHAVLIVAYKEPVDVLCRTFDSILAQKGLHRPAVVALAVEARDRTWPEAYAALSSRCGGCVSRVLASEHVLQPGETAGKSSNENSAVRDLYRRLVEDEGHDPFEVLVTIVDADSVLSSTYLAHAEASFYEHPDGRRLIYSGPLNTYRNFGDANFLIQQYELSRCHHDTFHDPSGKYFPQSNYTLALGFAKEIDFWTPDNMPEDIHTANKAALNNFGGLTTVAIPSLICNDLVVTLPDRYTQAKRHMWGSVTELPWQIATARELNLSFRLIFATVYAEAMRDGSFLTNMVNISAHLMIGITVATLWAHRDFVERERIILLAACAGVMFVWKWVCFWFAEHWFWRHLVTQFDVKHVSPIRWFLLVLTSPVCHMVNDWLWTYIPTLHCLYHITFVGELAYVCAPKGGIASGAAPSGAASAPRADGPATAGGEQPAKCEHLMLEMVAVTLSSGPAT